MTAVDEIPLKKEHLDPYVSGGSFTEMNISHRSRSFVNYIKRVVYHTLGRPVRRILHSIAAHEVNLVGVFSRFGS